ncbi:glycine amidinotransferase [Micrococcus yunnanensis]|uniref:Glycine amidinotransferase n=1 Tax=Micrococcus yunnanensis TaxID=566027 RepID=A0ABR6D4A1_9MICC|nr:glycine amidinotransferase [Micrococcus yunnanensis]MBA9060633.1 glycine amidinotransferase [Micrococcus yunnanensis]TFE80623.1 glycine amidinotransferase [Micrococcus yunnanensis]
MTAVNSHDEWSPLREIIVGSANNYVSHDRELSFDIFFHENLYHSDWAYPRLRQRRDNSVLTEERSHRIKERYVEELIEDVEGLAETLQGLDVKVHRPVQLPSDADPIAGFGWQAPPVPPLNLRDNTLIVGSEIIETPPAIRSRYLETRFLSKVFMEYFEAGSQWTTMPRPVLTDASFDQSYANDLETSLGGPTEVISDPQVSPYDVGLEMILDGAQCLRLGQDIVVNVANENHAKGYEWLRRHLSSEYRVHRVDRMSDNHIDSMILALRPGLFLARHPDIKKLMPKEFQGWKYLVPPEPKDDNFPSYEDSDLVLTSPYIDLNVLSVSPDTVLVNRDCLGLIRMLEGEGFTVVPVQHRHRRLFGGGFHCFTLDTVRDSSLTDYR